MVNRDFFQRLPATNCTDPICQHREYELGENDARRAHFKKDLAMLREWLKAGWQRGIICERGLCGGFNSMSLVNLHWQMRPVRPNFPA